MKRVFAIICTALAALAFGPTGCAVEGTDDVRTTTEAYQTGASCSTNNGINPMKAALAVAMAQELGRIDPVRDLYDTGWGIGMTQDAQNLCKQRGFISEDGLGCPNTHGILGMQYFWVNFYLPTHVFNATTFFEELKASFDRQKSHEQNLARNQPWLLPSEHQLYEAGTSDYGACGIHYDFDAEGRNISNLKERMVFFGGTQNPFIDFRSTEGTISIDPSYTMNGSTDANSGSCSVGCYGYGTHRRGTCCSCGGSQGTFLRAPWDSKMVYCAY